MQSHHSQNVQSSSSSLSWNSSTYVQDQQQPLDICELITNENPVNSGVILKLTDECSAAIKSAISSGRRIRIHVVEENKSATLEIEDAGNGTNGPLTFKCTFQGLGGPVDAICQEEKHLFSTISSINSRLQVQATEKTFAEMKQKTQKIQEEDQKRMAKEISKGGKVQSQKKKPHHQHTASALYQPLHKKSTNISTPSPMLKRYSGGGGANNNSSPAPTKAHSPYPQKRKRDEQYPSLTAPPTRVSRMDDGETAQQQPREEKEKLPEKPVAASSENYMETFEPSCDWSLRFKKIDDFSDAKRYHEIFHSEYTEYKELFESLSSIAKEFEQLGVSMKRAEKGSPDRHRIEETIQSKFVEYQHDEQFLRRRRRHVDLRAKLEVLKQRIQDWERDTELENRDY